jgi:nucleotide-binding universal stress UspA family protein
MYRRIMVPVDGSKLAERALTLAVPLAEQHGAGLVLVQVHEPILPLTVGGGAPVRDSALDESWREDQLGYEKKLARRVEKLTGAPVEAVFRDGRVVSTLTAFAAESDIGLIVMCTHGRGGFQRLWLGSVADGLMRHSPVPVLLIRGARQVGKRLAGTPPFSRVVIPLDGSARSETAIAATRELLGSVKAKVTLVHVVHPMSAAAAMNLARKPEVEVETSYLEPLAAQLRSASLDVGFEVHVDGNVARAISKVADAHDADLIAIAGQGMGGVQRLLIGSVADKLIRTASASVLVIPSSESDRVPFAARPQGR